MLISVRWYSKQPLMLSDRVYLGSVGSLRTHGCSGTVPSSIPVQLAPCQPWADVEASSLKCSSRDSQKLTWAFTERLRKVSPKRRRLPAPDRTAWEHLQICSFPGAGSSGLRQILLSPGGLEVGGIHLRHTVHLCCEIMRWSSAKLFWQAVPHLSWLKMKPLAFKA